MKREDAVRNAVEAIEDGWCGGTQPVHLYHLSRGLQALGEIVEIGTFAGKSTTALAMGQHDAGGRPIHTVDHMAHPRVKENLERNAMLDWVRCTIGSSRDVASAWTLPIELLFIDAGHRYEDVRGDVDAWTPLVIEGGIVAIHDYPGWEKAGPQSTRHAIHKALHETLMNEPERWKVMSDREYGSLIVFRRINAPPRNL